MKEMRLLGKVMIRGKIKALSGLHIGAGSNALDIGGIDNPVIKDSAGRPYIPGSSLKGKMRCLLERYEGYPEGTFETSEKGLVVKTEFKKDYDKETGINLTGPVAKTFGIGASSDSDMGPTRFYCRDAYLSEKTLKDMKEKSDEFEEMEMDYTESKWENTIHRLTSKASNPRIMERVPAGAEFDAEFVYNIYTEEDLDDFEHIIRGIKLLEDDFIGGSGTRGSGHIAFQGLSVEIKTRGFYESGSTHGEVVEWDPSLKLGDYFKS
ncbi:MAG TPA: type III-A CRISPR-associated RAMP protein Csm3 [Candidatus Mcinerneyibacteriales bacterium]|nr:type III-A CRISPR-associated RAMP protein Csm3 [Candidatus Mcinerneyibacteriales bacterium]